jgi:hypothetical protein
MRNIGLIGCLVFAVVFVGLSSCTDDAATDAARVEAPGGPAAEPAEAASAADPATATATEALTGEAANAIRPATDCSTVAFCNEPGANGTTCTQNGCGLKTAENECQAEVVKVCGSATSPFVFHSNGGDIRLHIGACPSGALSCGGSCCNTAATFCGGSGHTACCDGIHCSASCPCT